MADPLPWICAGVRSEDRCPVTSAGHEPKYSPRPELQQKLTLPDDGPPLDTRARTLWRGELLVGLVADDGERDLTRLADTIADLMHWANEHGVDFTDAVFRASDSAREESNDWWKGVGV